MSDTPSTPLPIPDAAAAKFTPPRLSESITTRLKTDPGRARVHYGIADERPLGPKEIPAMLMGIKAAQREVDDWAASLDVTGFLGDAAQQQAGVEKINLLRNRVNVPEGASVGDMILAVLQGKWRRNVIMLCPLNRPIEPSVHWAHMALLRRAPWMGYDQVSFPSLPYARNKLVQNFLNTEAEWAFWLDGDTVPPFGDAGSFGIRFNANPGFIKADFLAVHAADKLISNRVPICGAIVADRSPGNRLIIQPDLNPRNDHDRQLVRRLKSEGPQKLIEQVPYIGTGCCVMHRGVFVDIMKKFPERGPRTAGEPFNFFGGGDGMDSVGEDMVFCKLASDAGHPSHIDCSVWAAHVGVFSFFPQQEKK